MTPACHPPCPAHVRGRQERLVRHGGELRGFHMPTTRKLRRSAPSLGEKGNRRWPNMPKVLKERLIGSVITRHIGRSRTTLPSTAWTAGSEKV